MDQVYRSRDHGWLSVHGGLATMGQRGRFEVREVIIIARRERERKRVEEVVGVVTNVSTHHLDTELRRWSSRHCTPTGLWSSRHHAPASSSRSTGAGLGH
jgi:hypothetical protein